MSNLKLYNTLSHSVEEFKPIDPPYVGMYSCGPTVYDYQHIGHMRRYVGDDILVRILKANGYDVKHVMNITDVGHLTSDSDEGEDKLEKGARKYGKSVWDIAKFFEEQFFDSCRELNINRPDEVIRATGRIDDQIELIKILEEKGYTYIIEDDGVYFDTAKFNDYFKLSGQNPKALQSGARVEVHAGKKQPWDFALWKFSPKDEKRQMEWDSPWGKGFPGWHIECSAMSMKELGPHFDIHTGGIDHIAIHHTNEIAQSECASGQKFVNYWVHHNFLVVESEKMSKSLDNFITVQDLIDKGYDPIALRYLFLQTHYRQEMNFTWEALDAAQTALNRLRSDFIKWPKPVGGFQTVENEFMDAVNDDMNMAQALAIMWDMVKSKDPQEAKAACLLEMDKILGLHLAEFKNQEKTPVKIPADIMQLVEQRNQLRKQRSYTQADHLRNKILKMGWDIQDVKGKTVIKKVKGKA